MFAVATLVAPEGKELACDAGGAGSVPGSGRCPGERNGYPLQDPCLEFHGQRSLVGYSPWGLKESDVTEHLSTCLSVLLINFSTCGLRFL